MTDYSKLADEAAADLNADLHCFTVIIRRSVLERLEQAVRELVRENFILRDMPAKNDMEIAALRAGFVAANKQRDEARAFGEMYVQERNEARLRCEQLNFSLDEARAEVAALTKERDEWWTRYRDLSSDRGSTE